MELCSALRRELDWSCLREKCFVSPNHVCARVRSISEARNITKSSLTHAQPAMVQLDLLNPVSDYNRLSGYVGWRTICRFSHQKCSLIPLKSSNKLNFNRPGFHSAGLRPCAVCEERFCLAKPVLTYNSVSAA